MCESHAIHLGAASIDMDQSVPVVPTRNRCPNPCFEMDIVKAHVVSNDRGRVRTLRSDEKPPSIVHRSTEVPELDGRREIDGVRPHAG